MDIYSVWVLPRETDANRFHPVIDALCQQQNVPRFQPHLTLGGLTSPHVDYAETLDALSGLVLTPIEIAETPVFTKSLFVRFAISDALQAGRRALEALPEFRSRRAFDPHVSLCYGPPKNRLALEVQIEALLSRPVQFDRLSVTRITSTIEQHSDLEAWETVSVFPIGS